MPESLLYFITAFLYAVLAALAWYRIPQATTSPSVGGDIVHSPLLSKALLPVAMILHAALLFEGMFGGNGLNLNIGMALSLIVWLTILVYWVESYWVQVGILQNLLLPIATI